MWFKNTSIIIFVCVLISITIYSKKKKLLNVWCMFVDIVDVVLVIVLSYESVEIFN